MTIVVISGLITMISLKISRSCIKINIIVIIMSNRNGASRNCTIVDIYDKIIMCTNLIFIYMIRAGN